MRRLNNLVTLFSAMFAFFFGCFLTTTLTNIEKCTEKLATRSEHHNEIFLIVLIISSPSYFERRQVIRDTWLKLGKPLRQPYYPEENVYFPEYDEQGFLQLETVAEQANRLWLFLDWMNNVNAVGIGNRRDIRVKHYFVIGTKELSATVTNDLNNEQKNYQDLLLLDDFEDTYANLTTKILLSFHTLIRKHYFGYILKTDDDTYVKLDFLLNELVSYDRKLIRRTKDYQGSPLPELYWGYFNGRAHIKNSGQWKEEHYYLCDRYIPYALGGGYVISRALVEFVDTNAKILSAYVSEDISLGTWLSPLRHVYRRHDVRFDTAYMPRKCGKHHIVLHKKTGEEMLDLYNNRHCTSENLNKPGVVKYLPEYHYNWKKTADKCCNSLA